MLKTTFFNMLRRKLVHKNYFLVIIALPHFDHPVNKPRISGKASPHRRPPKTFDGPRPALLLQIIY